MKYKHEFKSISDHYSNVSWTKCVKCNLVLYYHGWSLKQISQVFIRDNEHESHKDYYRTSLRLITERYTGADGYDSSIPSGHIIWSDGKHTYKVNPINGKKLDKSYCPISGTDKMISDILK